MKFPISCPRCQQGPVHWVRVQGIEFDFIDCFDCDAVWLNEEELSPTPTHSYENYVRSFGLDPLTVEEVIVDDVHGES